MRTQSQYELRVCPAKAGELLVPSECDALQSIPLPSLQDTLIADQIAVLCNAVHVRIWRGMVAIIMEPDLIVPECHTLIMS